MISLSQALIILLLALCSGFATAQDLFIKNAKVFALGDVALFEQANILIRDGKIAAVGPELKVTAGASIIDATDKQVTPGLVSAFSHLGLQEIAMVEHSSDQATQDTFFSASFNISPAVNPNSTLIPLNRMHGLTRAIVGPTSTHHLFAGQGALISLAARQDFLLNDSVALFARYGSAFGGGSRAAAYMRMQQAFIDAREYQENRKAIREGKWHSLSLPLHDLEALLAVLNRSKPLVVMVERASDIRALLKLKTEFRFRLVLAGASEAWMVAEDIAAAQVAVIVDPMANLPLSFDQLGARLDNSALLEKAGVTVLFAAMDFTGTHSAYLVRQGAGNAAAYGMSALGALQAITINPAKVFGFAHQSGSIEVGKDADLVIWDGDPLELLTLAEQVIIQGKIMPRVSRATRLRDRYRNLNPSRPHIYQK